VDFEQLKIENQQYFERIDGKNKELLQLKLSTGKTVQVRLSAHTPHILQTLGRCRHPSSWRQPQMWYFWRHCFMACWQPMPSSVVCGVGACAWRVRAATH
jgi:hypothetical protein